MKLTLNDVTGTQNQTSLAASINANNTAIENALENTLSRDGTSPNTMGADLDMNSNQIINLPYATTNTEPVTLGQFDEIADIASLEAIQAAEATATAAAATATAAAASIPGIATQAEAEAGTINTALMTPLRTAQAVRTRGATEQIKWLRTADADATGLFEYTYFRTAVSGNRNAVVGAIVQDGSGGNGFPCGITGYGKLNNAGNQAFGMFGRADAYTAGVATHELNTFNYSADSPTSYPQSRAFGISTTLPICLTIAAGGTYKSFAGIEIGQEGSSPNSFQYGIAVNKSGVSQWSYYQDADATTGPSSGMYMAIPGSGINLVLKTTGTASPKNAVLQVANSAGNPRASIRQDGSACFGSTADSVVPARLNVAGSDTVRGLNNTSVMAGVDLSAANSLGACVQLGSVNGNTPYIAASRYSTSDSVASPLVFYTDATERLRIMATGAINIASGGTLQVNGTQVLTSRDTGWVAMTGTGDKATTYDTSTVTLAQLAARVKQLQDILMSHGLIGV